MSSPFSTELIAILGSQLHATQPDRKEDDPCLAYAPKPILDIWQDARTDIKQPENGL